MPLAEAHRHARYIADDIRDALHRLVGDERVRHHGGRLRRVAKRRFGAGQSAAAGRGVAAAARGPVHDADALELRRAAMIRQAGVGLRGGGIGRRCGGLLGGKWRNRNEIRCGGKKRSAKVHGGELVVGEFR